MKAYWLGHLGREPICEHQRALSLVPVVDRLRRRGLRLRINQVPDIVQKSGRHQAVFGVRRLGPDGGLKCMLQL